jgi:hypothetical protein
MFLLLRKDMGHTWPVGTFNRSADKTDVIDGEYQVIEDPKQLEPGNLTTQQPNNPTAQQPNHG